MGLLFGMALFGTTFSLPAFTQRLLHYSAYEAGWVLFPRAVTLFLVMPIAGWLFNHVNSRLLIAVGVGLTYWGFHQLAHLSLDAGFWDLAPIMLLMGAGMPCIFVTLSTVSLRAVRREDMTAATGLYTLARRVGGNISYALVATFIERFSIIHRSDLVKHVSDFNSLFLDRQTTLTSRLIQQGADPVAAQSRALALANAEVNRQATMLAYNDIAWIFGFMFLGTLPLLLLLRARRAAQPTIERTGP
jgi:DHA2 family multidrug resistance protein